MTPHEPPSTEPLPHSHVPASERATNVWTLLTGAGPAAIAAVRLTGPAALGFAEGHVRLHRGSWTDVPAGAVRRAALLDADGEPVDDVLVWLRAREPVADLVLYLHGSPVLVDLCRRLAETSAFTASNEPQTDLWPARNRFEAAGWARLPQMQTETGVRWLLDQIDRLPAALRALSRERDEQRVRAALRAIADRERIARWFATPLRIAVVGPPNAGKSTLINAVSGRRVSLVSHVPGTTRDYLEHPGEQRGFPVTWIDTAGLRHAADALEAAGIEQTRRVVATCDVLLVVLDVTAGPQQLGGALCEMVRSWPAGAVVALNKTDLPHEAAALRERAESLGAARLCEISAAEGRGLDTLADSVLSACGRLDADLSAPAALTAELAEALRACARAGSPGGALRRLLEET